MIRRKFISLFSCLLAGSWIPRAYNSEPDRDSRGRPLASVFVFRDGQWINVPRGGVRSGERFLMLGLNDGRLWKLFALTVEEPGFHHRPEDGSEAVYVRDELDLLKLASEENVKVFLGLDNRIELKR